MVTDRGCKCGHRTHDTWGCLNPECGCDTPRDKVLVDAAERAERDRLLARIEELADGFHDHAQASRSLAYRDVWQSATRQLRALLAEEREESW